jgi:hypothetical protein
VNLTYNPKSGHVKLDGALIGRVTQATTNLWTWSPFTWDQKSRTLSAPSRDLLFVKIRQALVRQNVAPLRE